MSAARLWWATGLGLVALFVAFAAGEPGRIGGPDACLFHRLTGVACAGCGLTRAASAFAHGDLAGALHWHPLLPLFAFEVAVLWLLWGMALRAPERLARLRRVTPALALANGILLILVWLLRLANGSLPA